MKEAILSLMEDKGISEDFIRSAIERFLLVAYKAQFGKNENAEVVFSDDGNDVDLYAKKKIVDLAYDEVTEIEIEDALELVEGCEIGDTLSILIDPTTLERKAIMAAKQDIHQQIRDYQKNTLYAEYCQKQGELIIGYIQREKNGNFYIDLGKIEGILPKRFQAARERYQIGDRIKTLVVDVSNNGNSVSITLSRTDSDFVRKLFELEVPEIYDGTVEVVKIVREHGYRTKMAVRSKKEDVDPVGACVGLKGVRIQNIVRELDGEKIDVLRYDPDPTVFIKNALSPAEIKTVIITDEAKRSALAVVEESQLSLVIGKQGQNVKLANRLVDWNIDVKTIEQFKEMEISHDAQKAVNALFVENPDESEEIVDIAELPGITDHILTVLTGAGITKIEQLISLSYEELSNLEALSEDDINLIDKILSEELEIEDSEESYTEYSEDVTENYDQEDSFAEEETAEIEEEIEIYECPECGAEITLDMEACPNCGIGLSFEEEEVEE